MIFSFKGWTYGRQPLEVQLSPAFEWSVMAISMLGSSGGGLPQCKNYELP
jgi:hypothetical protein